MDALELTALLSARLFGTSWDWSGFVADSRKQGDCLVFAECGSQPPQSYHERKHSFVGESAFRFFDVDGGHARCC